MEEIGRRKKDGALGELRRGTPAFRRVSLALFAGGFATFAGLYVTQPLLPLFSQEFGVSPAVASLSLSVATGTLAVALLMAGSLSEALGRKPVMAGALFLSSLLGLAAALAPDFRVLLAVRVLQGLTLAGLPATAMAYLGEEVHPADLGAAMGLYISGTSIGGMAGRLITGGLAEAFSWREAVGAVAAVNLGLSLLFWRLLPPSAHFRPRPLRAGELVRSLALHLRDPGLRALYGLGFLLMGSFVTLYNYMVYELVAPPYGLSQGQVGSIFLFYLAGAFGSAWMGRLGDRIGRPRVLLVGISLLLLGAWITLGRHLAAKLGGLGLLTFGYFGAHATASGWVGERARTYRAQASALYLFFYYLGSSVAGTGGGTLWQRYGWPGVVGLVTAFMATALFLAGWLARLGQGSPAAAVARDGTAASAGGAAAAPGAGAGEIPASAQQD